MDICGDFHDGPWICVIASASSVPGRCSQLLCFPFPLATNTRAFHAVFLIRFARFQAIVAAVKPPQIDPFPTTNLVRLCRGRVDCVHSRRLLRDQTVLQATREWQESRRPDSALVRGIRQGDDYATVWEFFASIERGCHGETLLCLADQILAHFRNPRGVRIGRRDTHEAFVSLWRRANRQVTRDEAARDLAHTRNSRCNANKSFSCD
jgi:hypothetical protein